MTSKGLTSAETPWRGLALAISPDRVVLGPEAARLLLRLIAGADRAARHDGIALPPQLRAIRETLAAVSSSGHADVRCGPDVSASPEMDEIGTPEAAKVIGCSREHAGRLAREGAFGPSRKVGGRRLVSRAQVAAYRTHQED